MEPEQPEQIIEPIDDLEPRKPVSRRAKKPIYSEKITRKGNYILNIDKAFIRINRKSKILYNVANKTTLINTKTVPDILSKRIGKLSFKHNHRFLSCDFNLGQFRQGTVHGTRRYNTNIFDEQDNKVILSWLRRIFKDLISKTPQN